MAFFTKTLSAETAAMFYRQMAAMIASGVPVPEALETLSEENENIRVGNLAHAIKSGRENGFSKYPDFFQRLLSYMMENGEQGKAFSDVLYSVADENEKMADLKIKLMGAVTFPVTTLCIAILLVSILIIFVIPSFAAMFESMHSQLPVLTRLVVAISMHAMPIMAVVLILFILAVSILLFNRRLAHSMVSSLPLVGTLIRKITIVRFSRYLSMMLLLRIPVVDAINSAAEAVGNHAYEEKLKQITSKVSDASDLKEGLKNAGLYPPMALRMIAAGEKSGTIERVLGDLSDYYEKDVDKLFERCIRSLEIVTIVFVGLVVGGLVIAMYLPIFQMAAIVN